MSPIGDAKALIIADTGCPQQGKVPPGLLLAIGLLHVERLFRFKEQLSHVGGGSKGRAVAGDDLGGLGREEGGVGCEELLDRGWVIMVWLGDCARLLLLMLFLDFFLVA